MKIFIIIGALLALLAVILGAFAAHGLKHLVSNEQLSIFQTGVTYQMYHALGLLAVCALSSHVQHRWLVRGCIAFIVGVVLFSGSLYLLALTQMKIWGPLTPLGGVAFIIGWAAILFGAVKGYQHE